MKAILFYITFLSVAIMIMAAESLIGQPQYLFLWIAVNVVLIKLCYDNITYKDMKKYSGQKWLESLIRKH